jgi:subtilisin family serine protease
VCSQFAFFASCSANAYLLSGGTSFATPIVSGVAALVDAKAGGALRGGQLKTALSQSAEDLGEPGTDDIFSHGRVNASRAVEMRAADLLELSD